MHDILPCVNWQMAGMGSSFSLAYKDSFQVTVCTGTSNYAGMHDATFCTNTKSISNTSQEGNVIKCALVLHASEVCRITIL